MVFGKYETKHEKNQSTWLLFYKPIVQNMIKKLILRSYVKHKMNSRLWKNDFINSWNNIIRISMWEL
jgi:hypothetical protein